MSKVRNNFPHKRLTVAVIAVLLIAGGVFAYYQSRPRATVSKLSPPLSHLPTQSSSDNKDVQGASSQVNHETATDKKGQSPSTSLPAEDQWTISESGAITVKSPIANGTFKPDSVLYGSSSLSSVQYRLVDDQAGVTSEGTLSVVNGNFSGAIHFKPYATSGRLDVYSTDATGKELNEVQIKVNF